MNHLLKKIMLTVRRKENYYIVLSLPLALLFLMSFPLFRIRLIRLLSDRVGHYAMNTELLCCLLEQQFSGQRDRFLFYNTPGTICNKQLYKMFQRKIKILPFFPEVWRQVDRILTITLKQRYIFELKTLMESREGYQDIHGLLGTIHQPKLSFTAQESQAGWHYLSKMDIPAEARFVCLLVRDAEYLKKTFPEHDWSYHDFRDADIATYEKTALYLAEQGYYVFRMGKFVKKPLAISHPHVIDYARHPLQSDFLDIFLSAHCHFFISTASGLDAVAQIFRRPVVLTNVAPFSRQLQYWYPCERFITKKVQRIKTKQWVGFKEIYHLFKYDYDVFRLLKQYDMALVDNSEDEILEVVKEMDAQLSGVPLETEEDQCLLERFKRLAPFSMIANNDNIQKNPERFYARLGTDFLRRHQTWI